MNRTLLQIVATGLTVCLLLLGALVYVQTVPHAAHHAHHKASTHATALCSWMCAAGQGIEIIQIVWHAHRLPLAILDLGTSEDLHEVISATSPSRGPPPVFA